MDSRYTELANRIGLGQSERIAKLFQAIADPSEADILLALPATVPGLVPNPGKAGTRSGLCPEDPFRKRRGVSFTENDPAHVQKCLVI